MVETTFMHLFDHLNLRRNHTRSFAGLATWLASKVSATSLLQFINFKKGFKIQKVKYTLIFYQNKIIQLKNLIMKKAIFILLATSMFLSCQDKTQTTKNGDTSDKYLLALSQVLEGKHNPGSVPKLEMVASKGSMSSKTIEKLVNADAPTCAVPNILSDLNSGSGFEMYTFTSDASASAAAMGFSGVIGKKEILIVQDYVRYQIIDCGGVQKRYGIGLRCFIHVMSIKSKLSGSVANIAAAVQIDNASATYSIESLGFSMEGELLAEGLDGTGNYNVENFGKLAITFNNVLKTLNNDNDKLTINPVELPN